MYVMVVSDNCPRCLASKSLLEKRGLLDQVDLINISTDRGQEIARRFKLTMAGADIIDISSGQKMSVAQFVESQDKSNA